MIVKSESEVAQLCLTLCDPMDCSLPGSSIRGIFQARILEWVAIFYSRGSSSLKIEPTSLISFALADGSFTTSATWVHRAVDYIFLDE